MHVLQLVLTIVKLNLAMVLSAFSDLIFYNENMLLLAELYLKGDFMRYDI